MERDSTWPEGSSPSGRRGGPGPLRPSWSPGPPASSAARRSMQLLARTDLRIRCLVRGARRHRRAARSSTCCSNGVCGSRVRRPAARCTQATWRSQARAGPPAWDQLARDCDAVLHNGALVNFLFDYRAHRAANVRRHPRAAPAGDGAPARPLHHVSTLGALDGRRRDGRRTAAGRRGLRSGPRQGAARRLQPVQVGRRAALLADARGRGALVTVYRLGEVMPAATTACPNPRALTHLLLSAFQRLGAVPAVADALRLHAGRLRGRPAWWRGSATATRGRTLHVFHPESVCFDDVLRRVGCADPPVRRAVRGAGARARATGDRELTTLRHCCASRGG